MTNCCIWHLVPVTMALLSMQICGCNKESNMICEPGETQICVCPGGESGAQSCSSDGKQWESCQCEPPVDVSEDGEDGSDEADDTNDVFDVQDIPDSETTELLDPTEEEGLPGNPCEGADFTEDLCFVRIPSGTFVMGSPETETGRNSDEYQYEITLTHSFYMAATETTVGQWGEIMNDIYFQNELPEEKIKPHSFVDYTGALWFCNRLSALDGLSPCYELENCRTSYDPGFAACDVVALNYASPYDCPGYRLPTEAEWEYAARSGTTTVFYAGDPAIPRVIPDPVLDRIAWYTENAEAIKHPVALKEPNAWFLYDMLGNAKEYVYDRYVEDIRYLPSENPWSDPLPFLEQNVVFRGGSFSEDLEDCRCASRWKYSILDQYSCRSFRVVRTAF